MIVENERTRTRWTERGRGAPSNETIKWWTSATDRGDTVIDNGAN